ncbi:unnamed protein product [Brugia pahangi]|uniref:Uncharacterized protein n=1 Tax=Brugia pahangi TaxID=6280 RepID=A0A0N4TKD7_BRUPA|nr:unnamed protein product [Brugia pahangi]
MYACIPEIEVVSEIEQNQFKFRFMWSKLCEFKQYINDDADIKEYQNALSNDNKQQLESSAPNTLILELQQRIGGSNESALALLEQLKKCLTGGAVSSNIHLNPEIIRKNT